MYQSIIHFPIWQGAGGRYGYAQGAGLLRQVAAEMAPVVDVPVDDADFSPMEEQVKALATLRRHFIKMQDTLAHVLTPTLVLGGDCVCDYVTLAHALAKHGRKMAVLWVDAHPDINNPRTSPSGNFHGMLLRGLMGDAPARLKDFFPFPTPLLQPEQLFYVGLRDADMDEEEFRIIAEKKILRLSVEEVEAGRYERLFTALQKAGIEQVYVHVDSDVMDLKDYPQAVVAVEGGIGASPLIQFLQAVRRRYPVAGAALTEYSLEQHAGEAERDLARRLLVDGLGLGA